MYSSFKRTAFLYLSPFIVVGFLYQPLHADSGFGDMPSLPSLPSMPSLPSISFPSLPNLFGGGDGGGGNNSTPDISYGNANSGFSFGNLPLIGNLFGSSEIKLSDVTVSSEEVTINSGKGAWDAIKDFGAVDMANTSESASSASDAILRALEALASTNNQRTSHQSFGALITGKSSWALLLDLDGDGVRGTMWDGILYNIFFHTEDVTLDSYVVRDTRSPKVVQVSRPQEKAAFWKEKALPLIAQLQIPMASKLSNGETVLGASAAADAVFFSGSTYSRSDRQIIYEGLIRTVVLQPAISTAEGPILSRLDGKLKSNVSRLIFEIRPTKLGMEVGLSQLERKKIDAMSGPYIVSSNRLAAVLAILEHSQNSGIAITQAGLDGLRAALLGVSVDLKRMDIEPGVRSRLVGQLLRELTTRHSDLIYLLGKNLATPAELEQLQNGIYKDMPTLQQQSKLKVSFFEKRGWRVLTSAAVGALVAGAYMMTGHPGVHELSDQSRMASMAHQIATYALPIMSGIATYLTMKVIGNRAVAARSEALRESPFESSLGQQELPRNALTKATNAPLCIFLFRSR